MSRLLDSDNHDYYTFKRTNPYINQTGNSYIREGMSYAAATGEQKEIILTIKNAIKELAIPDKHKANRRKPKTNYQRLP